MNTSTALEPASSGLIQDRGENLEVSAFHPQEMLDANSALILWCEKKIAAMKAEAEELAAAFSEAVHHKWKSSTLKRHASIAEKRVTFYEKVKAALEAGFYIVPNFPVTLFAVRTGKNKPFQKLHVGTYEASSWPFKQPPGILPTGEGEYKPCDPIVSTSKDVTGEGVNKKTTYIEKAVAWGDIEFPIQMAKPKIMEATHRAMAKKIFDQFGLFAPGTGDPIIVGEIVDPSRPWHHDRSKRITFIIAWHLDTRDL